MGIDIDEDFDEIGNDCACFAAGETPKHVFASVTGIKIGDGHMFEDPGCPNGLIALTQVIGHNCRWSFTGPVWHWEYNASPGAATFNIVDLYNEFGFATAGLAHCATGGGSIITNGGLVKWFGGDFQIAWTPGAGSPWLPGVADKLNVTRTPDTKMDFWPVDDTYMGTRIVKKSEQTNVLIKYNHTL